MDYVAPRLKLDAFNCPTCNAYSRQEWRSRVIASFPNGASVYGIDELSVSLCDRCGHYSIWLKDKILFPEMALVPMPVKDMPDEVSRIYLEARDIFSKSPKASAALLRLAVQKLCINLGEQGNNINDDIASLVQKGLPAKIQQALDIVRVVGNNAVHPGTIDIDDDPSVAASLFKFINLIVDTMITQPKEIEILYNSLPEGARNAITKRDQCCL